MLRTKRVTEESSETSPDAKGLKSASVPRRTTSGRTLTPSASREQLAEIYDFEAHNRALETAFPRVVPEPVLIDNVTAVLERHGFTGSSAINLVSNCRDELCRPFTEYLDQKWGLPSFNIASLAGMVFCGRTGFKAAMAHAPVVDGKERYVFWVAPHIAYSGDNEVGKVWRPGRAKASTACGALLALLGEIKSKRVNLQLDPNDIEMTLLKQQIMSHLQYGTEPTLVELTYAVHECILSDVKRTAAAAVNLEAAEYVIISGIQVHAGFSQTMFWPGTMTKYTAQGETDLYSEYAECATMDRGEQPVRGDGGAAGPAKQERICRLAASEGDLDLLKAASTGTPLNKVLDHMRLTLLHVAARDGQADVVKMLLDMFREDTAFLHAVDTDHMTAIDYAVKERHEAIAEVLMERGAGLQGTWLKERLVEAVTAGAVSELQRLMWFAKDIAVAVHSTDRDGRSLVLLALQHKSERRSELIEMLLGFGADLTDVDFYGNDAVSGAVALGDPKIDAIFSRAKSGGIASRESSGLASPKKGSS